MSEIKMKVVNQKTTVREELEYWNAIYILRRLNKYFNSLHGYERGLRGLSAEDFSMMVIEKIINGQRSWANSTKPCFLDFCMDAMKSELSAFRSSPDYTRVRSYDFSLENDERWPRIGLQDEFNGY